MAGLGAARELVANGVDTIALEARNRVGGRVTTDYSLGKYPIERGAEFLVGTKIPTWELVNQFGLRTQSSLWPRAHAFFGGQWIGELWGSGHVTWDGKPLCSDDLWIQIRQRSQSHSGDDISLKAFLDQERFPSRLQDLIAYDVRFWGADLDQISFRSFSEDPFFNEERGMGIFRVLEGYDTIPRKIAQELGDRVRLGCPVEEVHWNPEGVQVVARQNDSRLKFEAQRAIVAVPLGVLKAEKIRFHPPLPERKQQAIERQGWGQGLLTLWTFQEPFWRQSRQGLTGIATDLPSQAWWDPYEHVSDAAALKGYVAGRAGAALSSRSKDEIIEVGIRDLQRIFPKVDVRAQVTGFELVNWPADPFCLGLYSYCTPGAMGLPQCLAEPLNGTLYWAGEATLVSSVDYAWQSGRREAQRIVSNLKA